MTEEKRRSFVLSVGFTILILFNATLVVLAYKNDLKKERGNAICETKGGIAVEDAKGNIVCFKKDAVYG